MQVLLAVLDHLIAGVAAHQSGPRHFREPRLGKQRPEGVAAATCSPQMDHVDQRVHRKEHSAGPERELEELVGGHRARASVEGAYDADLTGNLPIPFIGTNLVVPVEDRLWTR